MHLMLLMSAGMSAGLVVSLCLRFVWSELARRSQHPLWRMQSARNELFYVAAHVLIGAVLGTVFALSWGFTAIVDVSWWQRGLVFGGVLAFGFGWLPVLLARSLLQLPVFVCVFWLSEITALCLAAGLNCSWHWLQAW